jgi:hypothetical protein
MDLIEHVETKHGKASTAGGDKMAGGKSKKKLYFSGNDSSPIPSRLEDLKPATNRCFLEPTYFQCRSCKFFGFSGIEMMDHYSDCHKETEVSANDNKDSSIPEVAANMGDISSIVSDVTESTPILDFTPVTDVTSVTDVTITEESEMRNGNFF